MTEIRILKQTYGVKVAAWAIIKTLHEGQPKAGTGILEHSAADWAWAPSKNRQTLTLRNKASAFGNVASDQNGEKPLPLNDLAASIEVIS